MARRSSKARRTPKARPQGVIEFVAEGYGFVKTAEGEFFVPAAKTNGAFPGDLVEVAPTGGSVYDGGPRRSSRLPSARVTKVVMRACSTIIGRYEVAEPFGVVVPEDPSIHHDIFTLRRESPQVNDGDVVEVRIIDYPSRNAAATGSIVRVLGSSDDEDLAIDLIVAEHQFETTFSSAAIEEANAAEVDVVKACAQGYRDLRDAFVFTVDPVDARDFDDAVSLEREGVLWHLGVHIADVSRYVPFGGSIDLEARRRATSVYLVDRVLPMIPEYLSNDVCSLRPGQDRLAVSVEAMVSDAGTVVSYEVFPSVIRSKARLSYDQAQVLLEAPGATSIDALRRCETPEGARPLDALLVRELTDRLRGLESVARSLFARRKADGCMDFDRVEAKACLDAEGRAIGISYRRRTAATQLIEESMILANHLVAEFLVGRGLPCVFRVHDEPDGDALRALYDVMQEFPLFKGIDKRLFIAGNPSTLQEVLARAEGLPQQELVNALLLRAMKRAVYRTDQSAHYGLALETYCHFTSPIRRYPDLLVHRMLKEAFFGHSDTYDAQKSALPWMAEHSSSMERKAEKAARQSQVVKIVEYLQGFIGTSFDAVISHVSPFGLTVRLECTATGMVPLERLGDEYFSYDHERHLLRGISTDRVYRLGQRLRVVLTEAVPRERKLTFRLADCEGASDGDGQAEVWDGHRWHSRKTV